MSPEKLQPQENNLKPTTEAGSHFENVTEDQIQSLSLSRKEMLKTIKKEISLKLYYQLEEKLKNETAELEDIYNWQQGKQNKLSKYSLVLDSNFFEQEFISN